MSAHINASFQWSKEEFLRAHRLATRPDPRQGRVSDHLSTVLGVMCLVGGAVSLYRRDIGWRGFLFVVLCGAGWLSVPLFIRRTALKSYAQMPDRDMEVTWDISDDGIRSKTEVACSENTWAFFQKVRRVQEGFLLYPSGSIFHWLPIHAFRDTADAERFAELASSKVRDYGHVA